MDPQKLRENSAKIAADPAEMGSAKSSRAHVKENFRGEARKDGLRFAAPNFAAHLCGEGGAGWARLTRAERRAANKAAWAAMPARTRRECRERERVWREIKQAHRSERQEAKSAAPLPSAFQEDATDG